MHTKKILLRSSLLASAATLLLTGSASALGVGAAQSSSTGSQATDPADRQNVQAKLAADKLKLCQTREKIINNTMDRVSKRGQNHVDDISKVATRVENFYSKSGKTLGNYEALVSDVNAKKALAQTAVNTVKSDQTSFNCQGTDPKGVVNTFKDDVKNMETANKAYRTSVKALVDGVKSLFKTASNTNAGGA